MNTESRVSSFMNTLNSISINDLERNKIVSIKLIGENPIKPTLLVSYSLVDDDEHITGVNKIEKFLKKLK